MIHKDTYNKVDFIGAKGLVFLGSQIIVYRRDTNTKNSPGCIDMIGGGREGDESPFDTFSREVMEGIGLNIRKDDVFFSSPFKSHDDPDRTSFFFVTKPLEFDESNIKFGNEGTEWLLMTPEEFISRPDGIKRQQDRVARYLGGKIISE